MKDGEKALLALAAVGGYLYWAKTKTSTVGNTPLSGDRRHGPWRDQVHGTFPKGNVLDLTKMGVPAPKKGGKPRKGGGHNAYNRVNSGSGMSRDDEEKMLMSLTPQQREAELAKRGLTGTWD